MKLTSPDFKHQEFISKTFTCLGKDINPALEIHDIPANAQSLALIVDDPDAPGKTWVHWVVTDIPVVPRIEKDSVPGVQGYNDFGRQDWGGPCPPSGVHRYFFKIYALDAALNLPPGRTKVQVEHAMKGHILAQSELIGLFTKKW